MMLQSCQNCWFNGLQYGSVGLPYGYCTRHRVVLNNPDETTCGQHIRKDLGFERAKEVSKFHSSYFNGKGIVRVIDGRQLARDTSASPQDEKRLRRDPVADAVLDFGVLDTTISSLAQLKPMHTARSVIAMTSLGRAYVNNCRMRGGSWTSGVHLYWWNKNRLDQIPQLSIGDIRHTGATSLKRQEDLAIWSIMMLRLSFIDDIVGAADIEGDEIGLEKGIADRAATAVQDFDVKRLGVWIRRELVPALTARLDKDRYLSIVEEFKRKTKDEFLNSDV